MANSVHNNKYDYSKINFKPGINKITIICPEHGIYQKKKFKTS